MIIIIFQIANDIRHCVRDYNKTIPTVLEIPSKDIPYDPEKDTVMQRVTLMLGGASAATAVTSSK